MELEKGYHINNSIVKVMFGNILDSRAEVIASSGGSLMNMGGGLSRTIRKAGGEVIREDAQTKLPVKIGDAIVTTAGHLHQKYVFHCITIDKSIDHSNTPKEVSEEDIQQYIIGHSIDKCFQLMHVMDLKSIAFPAVGAGGAHIPIDKVAEVMAETIGRNLRKTNRSLQIEIYLLDLYDKISQWNYLPMFEQFSAQEAISKMLKNQAKARLLMDDTHIMQPSETMPDTDKDVFISYSRKDTDVVKLIYEWLEKAGYKCWLDVDGMFSGVSFKKVIVDAIKKAKILLFMSSENSNKSRNVVSEVSIAVEYGKRIIPVRLDMSLYSESIEYDIVNHDYVVYDMSRTELSNNEILKKIVSTLKMSEE